MEQAAQAGEGEPLDRGDTPSFPGCDVASARIVGGTLAAFDAVLGEGPSRAFQPGGGLHHARAEAASGFCIYNDIGVSLADALARGTVQRAAYIDIDVHHGDGVMYGFYEDGRLLDIDFHQDGRPIFPGTGDIEETGRGDGAGLKVNVPFPPGAGDREFAAVWDRVVPTMLEEHRPDLIVLQCGVDGHVGDLLGHLRYRAETYERAVRSLMEQADRWANGRLVVTGGGGDHAANVALTLGMVGRRLAGGPPPGVGESGAPPAWGAEFRSLTGSSRLRRSGNRLIPVWPPRRSATVSSGGSRLRSAGHSPTRGGVADGRSAVRPRSRETACRVRGSARSDVGVAARLTSAPGTVFW